MHLADPAPKAQPPNLWRPQQFYTGRVGAPPPDAPATTASEWNKEAPTSGHIEALFAEKAVKTSSSEPKIAPKPQTTEPLPKIQLPMKNHPEEATPASAIPATVHAVISVSTKPDDHNGESKQARFVTFEVPAEETLLTKIPVVVEEFAQIAPAA